MSRRLGDLNVWRIHVVGADMSHSNNNVYIKNNFQIRNICGAALLGNWPSFCGKSDKPRAWIWDMRHVEDAVEHLVYN